MAEGIKPPPKFDGLKFRISKVKMTVFFLQSLGSRLAKTVTKPFSLPDGDEDEITPRGGVNRCWLI